jgi:hypothetical protein
MLSEQSNTLSILFPYSTFGPQGQLIMAPGIIGVASHVPNDHL